MNQQGRIEIWLPVVGSGGWYEVSSEGRVRSLPRNGRVGKMLTPQLNTSGYYRVTISTLAKLPVYIHHLVARAFIGERPPRADVNHINGIKTENHASNLEYLSRADNMRHAREMGLHNNRGDGHYASKLNSSAVREIRRVHDQVGLRGSDMAGWYGVAARTIDDVLDGKAWRSVE